MSLLPPLFPPLKRRSTKLHMPAARLPMVPHPRRPARPPSRRQNASRLNLICLRLDLRRFVTRGQVIIASPPLPPLLSPSICLSPKNPYDGGRNSDGSPSLSPPPPPSLPPSKLLSAKHHMTAAEPPTVRQPPSPPSLHQNVCRLSFICLRHNLRRFAPSPSPSTLLPSNRLLTNFKGYTS